MVDIMLDDALYMPRALIYRFNNNNNNNNSKKEFI